MKEILETAAAYGPRFLGELLGILSGPKRFLRQLDFTAPDIAWRALTFYVIAPALAFVLELPFVTTAKELSIAFVVMIVLFVIGTLLVAGLYKVSFAVVGGKGSFRDHLLITLYISAPFYIFSALFSAASKGIVLSNAPALYPLFKELMDDTMSFKGDGGEIPLKFLPLFENTSVIVAFIVAYLIFLFGAVWLVICWGAYRHVNATSKPRSIVALVVATILSIPVGFILVSAQRGLGVNLF